MKRIFLTLAVLLVLGSATFVHADPQDLREPSFPGEGAGEGDLMTVSVPGVGTLIVKAAMASMVAASIYR